jgi:hypothetical protein
MKKIYLTIAILLATQQFSQAQWATNTGNTITSTTSNVGIGTTAPVSALDVVGAVHVIGGSYADPGSGGAFWLGSGTDYANNFAGYNMSFNTGDNNARTSRMYINSIGHVGIGTTTPNAVFSLGSYMTRGKFAIYDNGNYQWGFGLSYQQFEQYFTNDDINNHFSWGSVSYDGNGTFTELMRLNGAGNVGIGTTTPDAKLAVNGTIHSKEVKVDLTGWPDYVFKSSYHLPALTEVKIYIDRNRHLPGMPSEFEVEKNGINLGEMVKQQTKKIEELTLYLIEQQKINQSLQAQINRLAGKQRPK